MKKSKEADLELAQCIEKIQAQARLKSSDQAVQSQFVELVKARTFRFCLHLTHSRERAEDLCQETLVKALGQIEALESPVRFWGWIHRIASNLFLDEKRRARSSKEKLDDSSEHGWEKKRGASSDALPDLALEVREVLKSLRPEDRTALILVDLEEYSYAEAASVLEISENALRSRIHRIRKAFIEALEATAKSSSHLKRNDG